MAANLAICMIVRDEAASLPRCLQSLAGLEARLYITDTGSTDNTRDIALAHRAVLREFPWGDDFSAARNHAIADVAEDWILNLDADDSFPPGEAAKILQFLGDASKVAYFLNYEVEEKASPALGLKLFRNHLGIRFSGIIHEYLRDSLNRFPADAIGRIPVLLQHSGYHPSQAARKLRRNVPLLQKEWRRCESGGHREQLLYVGKKMAEAALASNDPAEAKRILLGLLESMLDRVERHDSDWHVTLLTHLVSHYHDTSEEAEALACCLRFEPVFGRHPLFLLYRGITQARLARFEEALTDLEAFDQFVRSGKLDLAVPKALLGPELWNYQGVCHAALNRHRAAAAFFSKAVAAAPENHEYQVRLKLSLLSQPNGKDLAA
jgi:hypothetical protein